MKGTFLLVIIILAAVGAILLAVGTVLLLMKEKSGSKEKAKKQIGWSIASYSVAGGAFIAILGIMIWFIPIREESKKYNLTELEEDSVPSAQEYVENSFVQLSEVNMHYVKYGNGGHDVILIHGNGGNWTAMSDLASYLANDYTVYCIDERCHGESSDPGVITYELMAKDINEFIQAKGLVKPYVVGHSDGGMVGIALAANYPDSLGLLISCGSNSNPDTFKSYFTIGVKMNNRKNPSILNDLMLNEPDFTPEYLARITCPTYVVAGEFDIMPLSDSVYIHNNIKDSEIAIIKWGNHGSYFGDDNKYLYNFVIDYFHKIEG